jgi:hypothetical protein
MPLEIRELHIKVNVGEKSAQGGGKEGPAQEGPKEKQEGQDKLLAQCVDEVMAVLRNRKER